MEIFVHDTDWHDQFASVEEYVAERGIAEGEEFSLIRLTVGANTTYRVKDGKAVPESVAFPNALPPLDGIENEDRILADVIENSTAEPTGAVSGHEPFFDANICPKCRGVMHKGLAI